MTDKPKHTKPEVEITPEMIRAGADVLYSELGVGEDSVVVTHPELAVAVFRAMIEARPNDQPLADDRSD